MLSTMYAQGDVLKTGFQQGVGYVHARDGAGKLGGWKFDRTKDRQNVAVAN